MFQKRFILLVVVAHVVLILCVAFFASREGMLGKTMKSLTVTMMPKEKPPEIIKPKVEEPLKSDIPHPIISTPKTETVQQLTPTIPKTELPLIMASPPAVELPAIQFSDGAKDVTTISDPIELYKTYIEHDVKSQWKRIDNINDENYVVMIELTIDNRGKIVDNKWLSGSGDTKWDSSVKDVFSKIKTLSRPPPKGFPNTFQIKFDTTYE